MSDKNKVRKQVSEFYAKSINQGCGCGCNCGSTLPQGEAAITAGYTPEILNVLPQDAVSNSFGCGDPLAFNEVKNGQTVLDLGSGAGIDLLIAAKKVGSSGHVIGVDMTDDMIERARTNIKDAGYENVEVRKGIIEELPIDSSSVDWVISNCVINLSPEKDRVFAEIARVLKPSGRFSISDIMAKDLPDWIRENSDLYGACVSGAIDENEYLSGLEKSGLVDVKVTDRLYYDKAQLMSFISSEIPESVKSSGVNKIIETLEGKIWSAKVIGKKPE